MKTSRQISSTKTAVWLSRFPALLLFIVASGHWLTSSSDAQSLLIDVDFNNDSSGAAHGGPNPGPTMSGAAVLGTSGDLWNGVNATNGTGLALNYANGSNSPVTMTFTSGGGYDALAYFGSTPFAGTPYDALMEDYLFNGGIPQTITLSGLATNALYILVLYNAGDAAATGRTTFFTVNGNTQSSQWDGASSTLIAGVDYVEFTNAMSDASGNLVITYSANGAPEGDINGFQIQPAPTSTSSSLANADAYTWTTLAGTPAIGSTDGVGSAIKFNQPQGLVVDTNGNVYVADTFNDTIRKITAAGVSTTIVGFAGYSGTNDGVGSQARFYYPSGVALDGAGNLYVADLGNNRIRKITPEGTNWSVSTIAGSGSVLVNEDGPTGGGYMDGDGTIAQFSSPSGVAVDNEGNVYVADFGNAVIRQIAPVGSNWMVSTIAGSASYLETNDGLGSNARFAYPSALTVDSSTNIYVSDSGGKTVRKMTLVGTNWMVSTFAGSPNHYGTNDGALGVALFGSPQGIGEDASGNIYVADEGGNTIRKITPAGVVSTLAGSAIAGSTDATGPSAQFNTPIGLALDGAGNIYVGDASNEEIRKVSSAGLVRTFAGQAVTPAAVDATGSEARFNTPIGITVDGVGNLYVADAGNGTIREVSPAGEVTTLAGLATTTGTNDGTGKNALFNRPSGIAYNGNLYVADSGNDTLRLVTTAGVVNTILGSPKQPGSADGSGNIARFFAPGAVFAGATGIYVADTVNDTIRRITSRLHLGPGGPTFIWTATTLAGSATNPSGGNDGTNGAAQFYDPSGLAADSLGNIYVADTGNGTIRKVSPIGTNWVVTTIAGQTNNYGNVDGVGTNALFASPENIAIDSSGNLYVVDNYYSTVRKLTPSGTTWIVSTIGGRPSVNGSADGAGSAAEFSAPGGITVDAQGNLYVADTANNTIRKGVFTAYSPANLVQSAPPANGSLTLTLLPPEAQGQWRLPWEQIWHNSGDTVSNLVPDNYAIEFRSLPNFVTIQSNFTVPVANNSTARATNQFYPTVNAGTTGGTGSLTVNIGPNSPAGSGWRFLGETLWRQSGDTVTNLLPDIYYIEFEPVSGRSTPSSLGAQVSAGLPTVISASYLLAASPPPNVLLPFPVPASHITDLSNYPFGFNGQLQSDVGYGSGVAAQANVVLTAAHLVFNDQTLAYVSQAYWYDQREVGVNDPEPEAARGWYVLSGYASQRTNDLQSGLYGPDQSTPQSRNLDVAALYFLSPMAGGGYSGYLPSDATPNPWLTGTGLKMLSGYPVDGSQFGDASIVPGEMYQTAPEPFPLSLATDPVDDQQVYEATWFLSYPGNSGGPVYAQLNGYYYPVGVYLGTLFNGATATASLVRAIDSEVVDLITNAANLGDAGTNNSGGGVITIVPSQNVSRNNPAYMILQLGPPSAVAAGGAWKLTTQPASYYSTANPFLQVVTNTNALSLQFRPIPGWILPTNGSVAVSPGVLVTNFASYTVTNPVLIFSLSHGLQISGTTNTTYQIQSNSTLNGTWVPFKTNTLDATGIGLIANPAAPGFYRALWLTN